MKEKHIYIYVHTPHKNLQILQRKRKLQSQIEALHLKNKHKKRTENPTMERKKLFIV